MLVQLSQPLRSQLLLFEKLEYRGSSIMTREVVRRAGESRRAGTIYHRTTAGRATQIRELAEPARHHWPEVGVLRESQKRIAGPQLAVLVTAPDHVRALQPFLYERERHDVERMIGVHHQLRTHALAGLLGGLEIRHELRVGVEHRRDQHRRCAIVDRYGQPLGQRRGGHRRDLDYLDAFFRQAIELPADRVKFAVRGDQVWAFTKFEP